MSAQKQGFDPKAVNRACAFKRRDKGIAEPTERLIEAREVLRARKLKVNVSALSAIVGRHRGTAYMRAALGKIGMHQRSRDSPEKRAFGLSQRST